MDNLGVERDRVATLFIPSEVRPPPCIDVDLTGFPRRAVDVAALELAAGLCTRWEPFVKKVGIAREGRAVDLGVEVRPFGASCWQEFVPTASLRRLEF